MKLSRNKAIELLALLDFTSLNNYQISSPFTLIKPLPHKTQSNSAAICTHANKRRDGSK